MRNAVAQLTEIASKPFDSVQTSVERKVTDRDKCCALFCKRSGPIGRAGLTVQEEGRSLGKVAIPDGRFFGPQDRRQGRTRLPSRDSLRSEPGTLLTQALLCLSAQSVLRQLPVESRFRGNRTRRKLIRAKVRKSRRSRVYMCSSSVQSRELR